MTLSTKIEVFYGFYICSQWAFIHALLSRVPFALSGLIGDCFLSVHPVQRVCDCVDGGAENAGRENLFD